MFVCFCLSLPMLLADHRHNHFILLRQAPSDESCSNIPSCRIRCRGFDSWKKQLVCAIMTLCFVRAPQGPGTEAASELDSSSFLSSGKQLRLAIPSNTK